MLPDLIYLAALTYLPQLGPARWRRLKAAFGDAESAWKADLPNLIAAGIEESIAARWIDARVRVDPESIAQRIEKDQITLITPDDSAYPARLAEIHDAPAWLFCRGDTERLADLASVGIVGTRKISPYGRRATIDFAAGLARQGITIVSGLALGVDAAAHEAALDVNGTTIAVLASGIDANHIYPAQHQSLANRIIKKNGLIISEYPPGTEAFPHQFPYRNRIISGISLGTLVIEAPVESGALLTARYALEQNRDVFAVPGDIYSTNAQGTNNLIKMGAQLALTPEDILSALNLAQAISQASVREIIPASREEATLLSHLAAEPVHVDALVKLSGLPAATVNATLTIMEMSGKVQHLGGMHYVKRR